MAIIDGKDYFMVSISSEISTAGANTEPAGDIWYLDAEVINPTQRKQDMVTSQPGKFIMYMKQDMKKQSGSFKQHLQQDGLVESIVRYKNILEFIAGLDSYDNLNVGFLIIKHRNWSINFPFEWYNGVRDYAKVSISSHQPEIKIGTEFSLKISWERIE